jgi:hypothetical protein
MNQNVGGTGDGSAFWHHKATKCFRQATEWRAWPLVRAERKLGEMLAAATTPPIPTLAGVPALPAVSPPVQPVYREWVPQAGGWILADSQCTPIRGSFIADPAPRAQPAVPRAELVPMPVRRATLVEN